MEKQSSDISQKKIEKIAKLVTEIVCENVEAEKSRKSSILSYLKPITSNWVLFLFVLSVFGTVLGWLIYGISPLQPLEEISARQKEYRRKERQVEYRQRMVTRHIELANSFLSVGQLEAARKEFDTALQFDPNNTDAHLGKMKAEIFDPIQSKEYIPEIAEKKLKLILEEHPDDPHVLSFLGNIYLDISKVDAMHYYQKAIALDSTIASAYYGMAVIYDQEKNDEALGLYEKALSLSRWNQSYLNNLGYQYLQRGDYDSAIEKFELLLKLDARYLLAYYALSNSHRLNGNLLDAEWYEERLLDQLKNEPVRTLPRNNNEWFFHTSSNRIHFYYIPAKECYACYSAALTSHLLGKTTKSLNFINLAKNLRTPDEWLVKLLVRHDIDVLKQAQPRYAASLNTFVSRYL